MINITVSSLLLNFQGSLQPAQAPSRVDFSAVWRKVEKPPKPRPVVGGGRPFFILPTFPCLAAP